MTTPLRWPAEALWEAIAPVLPGFTVEVLPTVDSTNTELMRRARSGLCEPTLLVAEQQTAGRGRMGRHWHSGTGDSLTFSLGLPLAPHDWSGLSLAVGMSVAQSLQPTPPPAHTAHSPRIALKWPNDLWLGDDRKLGGILVETASFVAPAHSAQGAGAAYGGPTTALATQTTQAPTRFVVVGIGINITPRTLPEPGNTPACLQDLEPGLTAPQALQRIAAPLVATLLQFEAQGFAPLQAQFHTRDALHGRAVTLSDGQHGTAQGVRADGALLVHTAQGVQAVTSAQVSVRPVG